MSKETLEISQENALKAYENTNKKGKNLLSNLFGKKVFLKDIMERIQSFEDVCAEMGKKPEDYVAASDSTDDICENALRQWKLIIECFNHATGEVVDWSNSSQWKHYPWMKFSPGVGWSLDGVVYWNSFTLAGARLCFLNEDHCRYCLEQPEFLQIYLNYFTN